ncbi:MAG TPA: hypothetical protein VIT19_12335 [Pyrinomonadaceae bacterium]
MKRLILSLIGSATLFTMLTSAPPLAAQRRKVVVHPKRAVVRRPVKHTKLVVRSGHPVKRTLPATVVVRPARKTVVVGAPLHFLPAVAWRKASVSLPSTERLVWQDSEEVNRDEGWVDTNFGIDGSGNALFLQVAGDVELNFAEVAFANGNVQVLDFNEQTHGDGTYKLLDFADGRHVKTVRILARSKSEDATLTVYLSKS